MFRILLIDYGLSENTILRFFHYLFISKVSTAKVNFDFYKQCSKGAICLTANWRFLRKMLVSFSSFNILLFIEKSPVEKLFTVLEMELKIYTPVGPKFVFEKIDFVRQRPELSKVKLACSKIFLLIM